MHRQLSLKIWLVLLWAVLTLTSLVIRPLMPIDETRYAAVAWGMWYANDFLVPHLNGETYSHKPPLLFWLIQGSWWLFGVNEWSLRLISPLFALVSLLLTEALARQLWPKRNQLAEITPLIQIGLFVWIFFSTLTMFDIMLAVFTSVGMLSLLKQIRTSPSYRSWLLMGLAIGGGILSKGPVILLHILPCALLAPWWLKYEHVQFKWAGWYGGVGIAVITGAAIALCWAIPAGMAGGEGYRNAIFFGQTAGRMVDSFAHKYPWWWYLKILPVFFLPWLVFKPFWQGAKRLELQDLGVRFCLAWIVPVFIAFSFVSGKRIHYLLPLIPAIALLIGLIFVRAEAIDWQKSGRLFAFLFGVMGLVLLLLLGLNNRFLWLVEFSEISPFWGLLPCLFALIVVIFKVKDVPGVVLQVSMASIVISLTLAAGFFSIKGDCYDTLPIAQKINELRSKNIPVAIYTGKYHAQYNFTGRFTQPLKVLYQYDDLLRFAEENPSGYALIHYKDKEKIQEKLISDHFPYKSQTVGFISGQAWLESPIPESVLIR